jgi:protein phosphatase
VTRDAPIHNNSVIVADGQEYVCNLFAWDRTPVVTRVDAGWATTIGPVRDHNEDALGIYQHPNAYMFVVADGVGGGRDGDRFSEFAVQYLLAVFNKNIVYNLNWHDIFAKAFRYINTEVRNFLGRSAFPGGTTLTALVIKGWDARCPRRGYTAVLWHKDTLTQLTIDHCGRWRCCGHAPCGGSRSPLPREVLEKAIGKTDRIEPDLFTVRLQPGDKLLLCTDGVMNNVSLEEIVWLLRSVHISQVPDGLIRLALERNTSDNASAIAIDVLREPFIYDTWEAKPDERMYVGYDPLWSLRLRKPQDPQTEHPEVARAGCSIATVALAGLMLYGIARLIGGKFGCDAWRPSRLQPPQS